MMNRLVIADAYTISSGQRFESREAEDYSTYYLTFRRQTPVLKTFGIEGDDRIVFGGIERILKKLFEKPVTHAEIDEAKKFLENRKPTTLGTYRNFNFPELMWRDLVDDYGGNILKVIKVQYIPEGSVVYPGVPVVRVRNTEQGFGAMAAWFESKLLHVWATTERLTIARHWLEKQKQLAQKFNPGTTDEEAYFLASLSTHDFGDRASACSEESAELGLMHLYCFPGTDTFAAAYEAWKMGAPNSVGVSIDALAHRIVQGFENEKDCYDAIYQSVGHHELASMVADCYNYYEAVEKYLLPLAKKSLQLNNGKVVVARPDSGDPVEQVLWTCDLAKRYGLVERVNGLYEMTSLKFIQGDGMTFAKIIEIQEKLFAEGFNPHKCGVFGVGGYLRNCLARDNLSAKYALCAVGSRNRPVVKLSHTPGKTTLPMCKVVKDPLNGSMCLKDMRETGEDYMITLRSNLMGLADFLEIQERVIKDFNAAPVNGGLPSNILIRTRQDVIEKYI